MEAPKSNGKDAFYKGTKITLATTAAGLATLTAGPGMAALLAAGGAAFAVELFAQTFTPSLEKRRNQWLQALGEKLEDLDRKVDNFSIESLTENEQFITTLIQATQIAIRNHQEEKLIALRNAVLNAALPNNTQEDFQGIFLNWIDDLSYYHIQILDFLDSSLNKKLPLIEEDKDKSLVIQIVKDLEYKGLVQVDKYSSVRNLDRLESRILGGSLKIKNAESTLDGINRKRYELKNIRSFLRRIERRPGSSYTTSLGKRFMQFLKCPNELQ